MFTEDKQLIPGGCKVQAYLIRMSWDSLLFYPPSSPTNWIRLLRSTPRAHLAAVDPNAEVQQQHVGVCIISWPA